MGITRQQALDCCNSDDLIGIGMEADAVRRRLHPENVVTYVIDRSICWANDRDDFQNEARLVEALDLGATGITLRDPKPEVSLAEMEAVFTRIHARFPALWIHGLSATAVVGLSRQTGLHAIDILARLQAAGLQSLDGSDAGMLDDAVQGDGVQTRSSRCTSGQWLETHRMAHGLGLPTTAGMLFGAGETMEHRVHHLEAVRTLQEETGGFTAFVSATFQPAAAGIRGFEEATAVEYLRTLALCRIVLDMIPNVQADWATQGLKVLQMALRFGANDVGSTMPGEAVIAADGTTGEDLRRIIRGAGFRPVQRDSVYRTLYLV